MTAGDVESGGAQGGCTQEMGENDKERTDTHTGGEVSTRTDEHSRRSATHRDKPERRRMHERRIRR